MIVGRPHLSLAATAVFGSPYELWCRHFCPFLMLYVHCFRVHLRFRLPCIHVPLYHSFRNLAAMIYSEVSNVWYVTFYAEFLQNAIISSFFHPAKCVSFCTKVTFPVMLSTVHHVSSVSRLFKYGQTTQIGISIPRRDYNKEFKI